MRSFRVLQQTARLVSASVPLINLALRPATVFLVSDDYNGGTPDRLLGRASAGTSINAVYRRDMHSAYVGTGDDTANPGTVTVGGKTWLTAVGSSSGVLLNAAGSADRKRTDIFGAVTAPWSITVACSWASLTKPLPQSGHIAFGSTYYGVNIAAVADGRVGVNSLNSAGSAYNFACLPAGGVVPAERCTIQAQFNGTHARVRKRSGGVTGAWTTPMSYEVNSANNLTCVLGKGQAGPGFDGEFGGVFVEPGYAADMDDVLAAFNNIVGLP